MAERCDNCTGDKTLYEILSVRLLKISASGFGEEERTLYTLDFRRYS